LLKSLIPGILPVQTISVPVKSGDYYIKVDNQQEAGIDNIYSIRISASVKQETWELEPNNVSQMANTLALNKVIKGTSWNADEDIDWYRVRVNERQMLVVSIFKPTGQGTTEIKLMGSDLTDIASANTNALTGHKATIGASVNVGDYLISVTPSAETDRSSEYELVATTLKTTYSEKLIDRPDIDSDTPLSVGDIIALDASWIAGNTITYDIGDITSGFVLYDDGKHDDSNASDGLLELTN